MSTTKIRIDQLLVDLGHAPSRTRAQALLLSGVVFIGEARIDKPGTLVSAASDVRVKQGAHPYVSRGGVKLEGALADFGADVTGLRCLDVGASTGGFTDCLLQHGAAHVIAVDVGYGQLAAKLRDDSRVTVIERTNARTLTPDMIGGQVDLTVVDASFIGIGKLLSAIAACTKPSGHLLALIKPQFEVGKEVASKGRGIVRDEEKRREAIANAAREIEESGFRVKGTRDCRLAGPKGNVEAFVFAERRP